MSVRAPRAKKPEMVAEITRTLQAFDILCEEIKARYGYEANGGDTIALLAIAERIAARTSEED